MALEERLITGTIALREAPDQPLVEARGIFVMPRPEVVEAYFGTITDSAATTRRSPSRTGTAIPVASRWR